MPYAFARWQEIVPPRIAPSFDLRQVATGEKMTSLEDIRADYVVFAFLPGIWAPWARKYLDELNCRIAEFESLGIQLVVIVSQKYEQLFKYAKKNRIKVLMLSDAHGAIAKRYGVFDRQTEEPMKISKPSVFVLNHKHEIVSRFIGKHLMDRPRISEIMEKALLAEEERSWFSLSMPLFLKRIFYDVS